MEPHKKKVRATIERTASIPHYHTFPTKPPSGKGRPPSSSSPTDISRTRSSQQQLRSPTPSRFSLGGQSRRSYPSRDREDGDIDHDAGVGEGAKARVLKRQLVVLAVISLAEQTALNSISPYLPRMAGGFEGVEPERVGLWVGVIASCFAGAQVASELPLCTVIVFWGGGLMGCL